MELGGIKTVFTEAGYQPYVGSTKSLSGHALGAAGVHEAIYSLIMMQKGESARARGVHIARPEHAPAAALSGRLVTLIDAAAHASAAAVRVSLARRASPPSLPDCHMERRRLPVIATDGTRMTLGYWQASSLSLRTSRTSWRRLRA